MTNDLREKAEKIAHEAWRHQHDQMLVIDAIETALRDVQRKAVEAAANVSAWSGLKNGKEIATAIRALAPTPAGKGGAG